MTDSHDLDAQLDQPERDLAARLSAERPVLTAQFRGALGRYLSAHDLGLAPRPKRLRSFVAVYVGAGAAVAGLGTLQALGVL
jgi:hypothetical protein